MVASPRGATLRRRLRSTGGRLIRRLGLLPSGMPDGLGDDDALLGTAFDAEILVFFSDTVGAIYQLEQWYAAFRRLDALHRVAIVTQDSRVAGKVRAESGLPTYTIVHYGTLDDMLGRSKVRMALYVNHSVGNFGMLRFTSLVHVSLLHGDSDKTVSVSNQTKAYDFTFVAGQAAIDRVAAHIGLFDVGRLLPVGRPSLDAEILDRGAVARPVRDAHRISVLYAPSWEGAQPSAAYGSVESHGEAFVAALIEGGLTVVYRPHPLSGVRVSAYGDADGRIRALVRDAALADPAAGHRVDTDVPLQESFDAADVLLCDISAVSMEWLPEGRPLVITVPASDRVAVAQTPLGDLVPRLRAEDAGSVAQVVRSEHVEDPTREQRLALVEHYLGDTTPGASTAAFHAAIDEVLARRDVEWGRLVANGAVAP